MTALALDASVVAKLFVREADSPAALALLNSSGPLISPEHLGVEVASAITRRHRNGAISSADATLALGQARRLVFGGAIALVADRVLLPRAEEIALELQHALKDCLYVACAEAAGAELVTADAMLVRRTAARFPFVRTL